MWWGKRQTILKLCTLLLKNSGRDMKPACVTTIRKTLDSQHKDNCKLRKKNTANSVTLRVLIK